MGKFKFSKSDIEKMEKFASQKCEELAKEAADEMEKFYLEEVSKFYRERVFNGKSKPAYYKRHHDRGFPEKGMERTYERIFKDNSKGGAVRFTGGININTDDMYTDYHGTQEQVLYSFLAGYHGLPVYMKGGAHSARERNWYTANVMDGIQSKLHPLLDSAHFLDYVLAPKLKKKMNVDLNNAV